MTTECNGISVFGDPKIFGCLSTLTPQFSAFANVCLDVSVGRTLFMLGRSEGSRLNMYEILQQAAISGLRVFLAKVLRDGQDTRRTISKDRLTCMSMSCILLEKLDLEACRHSLNSGRLSISELVDDWSGLNLISVLSAVSVRVLRA